ncbi:cupin domain-containing protein [Cryobacterium sinapicolor]|uniref:Cupin domain-containing protein n=1 Tax=Cryobacterium sinapicolor TaxID=1259236 RepID=A0ABY2ITB1_9MICO|nr:MULTISPECIES: cupin domain-containing protein [Cryobacterium]TFC93184.1 cupin domain-containing protein [Cryobacterium sp. TMT3-29-2]TFC94295.1 cupin domain-containing protein [Cryobacterium sinapicolor]
MSATEHELRVKSLDSPDERRTPQKTNLDLNRLGQYTIGRLTMQPGWTWADCIRPIVQTDSCQLLHVGFCVSGTLETVLDDGTAATISAGDSYTIPPGHNARVVGDEPFVGIEFASAEAFAVPITYSS